MARRAPARCSASSCRRRLPGIVTGVVLALARIAGETAPLLFTSFNNRFFTTKLTQPIASLTVQVFTYAISPYEDWHRQAWAGALVLVTIVFICSLMARIATRRLEGMQSPLNTKDTKETKDTKPGRDFPLCSKLKTASVFYEPCSRRSWWTLRDSPRRGCCACAGLLCVPALTRITSEARAGIAHAELQQEHRLPAEEGDCRAGCCESPHRFPLNGFENIRPTRFTLLPDLIPPPSPTASAPRPLRAPPSALVA